MIERTFRPAIAAALLAATLCASAATRPTLYERLGGADGVGAIVSTLIDRVVADPRTARSFRGTNPVRIKRHLAAEICQLADGGCSDENDTLREIHAGHDIRADEFNALVEILEDVLRERGVALADRNALLKRLAPLRRDVVRVPPGAT